MLKLDINLLFTVINLLVLVFVVWKFLLKPVREIIAKRQAEVDALYTKANAAQADADELKKQHEEALKNVADEKAGIIKECRVQGSAEYDKIISEAKTEADIIRRNAKMEAAEIKARSMKETKEEIADLVAMATEKIVVGHQNPETDRDLFDEFIAKSGEAK